MTVKAIAALALALSACAHQPMPIAADRGPDAGQYDRSAESWERRIFNGTDNCGPDCFETFRRTGCDYDCRKKETLIGGAE